MSEAKRCPNCGCVLSLASVPSPPEASASASLPISDLESRSSRWTRPSPTLRRSRCSPPAVTTRHSWMCPPARGPRPPIPTASSVRTAPRRKARIAVSALGKLKATSSANFPSLQHRRTRGPLARATGQADYRSDDGEARAGESTIFLGDHPPGQLRQRHDPGPGLDHDERSISPEARGEPARDTARRRHRDDLARQSGLSRKVEPPEPILGEHLATMGRPLQVGSLEVTPLDVKRQDVQLQRSNPYAPPARREGGKKALILRLKLRNTTKDSVFAPLDHAYLRERGNEIVDTYVETADHQKVYPFPLAVDSELSIVGQDFAELKPGESKVFAVFSAPDAPPDSAGPFIWRVRLRTGIDRTDTIGIRWPDKPTKPKEDRVNRPGMKRDFRSISRYHPDCDLLNAIIITDEIQPNLVGCPGQ